MASRVEHDRPNVAYVHMGEFISMLAGMGASKSELNRLFAKGENATLLDIARIEARHTRYIVGGDGE